MLIYMISIGQATSGNICYADCGNLFYVDCIKETPSWNLFYVDCIKKTPSGNLFYVDCIKETYFMLTVLRKHPVGTYSMLAVL